MRLLKTLFFIILSVLLSSCTSDSFKSSQKEIQLKGNPTTGYSWSYNLEDDSIIKIEENVEYLGDAGILGAPSLFTYKISSLKPGKTGLSFVYKRPWEESAFDESRNYTITVGKKGDIVIEEEKISFKSVSMKEGLALMNESSDFNLLDVRRPDEYKSGHIPGAVLFTNETMTEEEAGKILPDKNQTVFVYCRSGRRSKLASEKLVGWGYTKIIEIGGINDYSGPREK